MNARTDRGPARQWSALNSKAAQRRKCFKRSKTMRFRAFFDVQKDATNPRNPDVCMVSCMDGCRKGWRGGQHEEHVWGRQAGMMCVRTATAHTPTQRTATGKQKPNANGMRPWAQWRARALTFCVQSIKFIFLKEKKQVSGWLFFKSRDLILFFQKNKFN